VSRNRSRWSGNLLWWALLAVALFVLIVYVGPLVK
jgi:hypothetical protein